MCQWGCVLWMPLKTETTKFVTYHHHAFFLPSFFSFWNLWNPDFENIKLIGSMIFKPTFETFKKAMNKKIFERNASHSFCQCWKRKLEKNNPHWKKRNFFLVLPDFDENLRFSSKLFGFGRKIDFFRQNEYSPKKCTHPLYPLLSLNCKLDHLLLQHITTI